MKMKFILLAFECLIAVWCMLDVSAEAAKVYEGLQGNLTIMNNALNRIVSDESVDITAQGSDISDILQEGDGKTSYTNEELFEISKYLKSFYNHTLHELLNGDEQDSLDNTMKQMPSSYYNILMEDKICLISVYNKEYLIVISDDIQGVVRAVSITPLEIPKIPKTKLWLINIFNKKENFIRLSNEAFQEHYHGSLLYNEWENITGRNEALLFIGLERQPVFTTWKLIPESNSFLIQGEFTEQYLCIGNTDDVYIWNYRFAYAVSEMSPIFERAKCIWEVLDCEKLNYTLRTV